MRRNVNTFEEGREGSGSHKEHLPRLPVLFWEPGTLKRLGQGGCKLAAVVWSQRPSIALRPLWSHSSLCSRLTQPSSFQHRGSQCEKCSLHITWALFHPDVHWGEQNVACFSNCFPLCWVSVGLTPGRVTMSVAYCFMLFCTLSPLFPLRVTFSWSHFKFKT